MEEGSSSSTKMALPSQSSSLQDASPDALKNTPSNIARLEDIIEQSKARQKYLAKTKSPSDGKDVRWYFCKVPLALNQVAASVPATEIVGKSEYFRFGMRDSLALEASFLQSEEEYLSAWWKEFAECSEGPGGNSRGSVTSHGNRPKSGNSSGQSLECDSDFADSSGQIYENDEETVGVPVKGGLYEVDLSKRRCFPVYWRGENRRVLRGHWFARKGGLEWLPLREDIAEQLECAYRKQVWHRRTFQPSGLFAARVDLHGAIEGLHALFTGEDDNWEAWLSVDSSGILFVTGIRGNGIKLRRGFAPSGSPQPTQDELRQLREEEMDDYCSRVPVRHLVFMVHGIGQRLEKANLVDDVATFRQIVASLAEQHLTTYQNNTQRVLFIPCQWRRSLKLRGEAAVEEITLEGVRGLRTMLSATVHDVLYYMSPIYCQDIIDSVSNQLNSLYRKFLKRNPGYDGKVSIYGHSLGSVLSYDILCHQHNLSSVFPIENICQAAVHNGESIDRRDSFSSNLQAGSPVFPKENKDTGNVSRNISDSSKKGMVEANLEEKNCVALKQTEAEIEKEEKTVSVREPRTIWIQQETVLNVEDGLLNVEDGHVADSQVSISEIFDFTTCKNSSEVIKSLKEEVLFLREKIIKLEGRHKVNDCSDRTVYNMPPLYSLENGENLESSSKELSSSPMDCREVTISNSYGIDPICTLYDEETINCRTSKAGSAQNNVERKPEAGKHFTPSIKYTKLDFKVDTFFAVGSPVGVFLSLRNVRIGTGNGQEYWQDEDITEEMPHCRQMFNIFHPYDPVAYRVEPLVCKDYVDKRPVFIPYHRGGKRLHIGIQEFSEDISTRSKSFLNHLNSVKVRMACAIGARRVPNDEDKEGETDKTPVKTYGSMIMERLTGSPDGRIDYMLQDSTFTHPYMSVLGSHTSYWRDLDTALFILKHLYREIPPELPEGNRASIEGVEFKDQGSSIDDSLDENIAFTFSNKKAVKALSSFRKKSKSFSNA